MRIPRLFAAAMTLILAASASLSAQGVTTGAISGVVTDTNGAPVGNAQVQITNRSTGYSTGGLTRESGSYTVQGLEVGGPYRIIVRRIGFQPVTRDNINVGLSATTRLDIRLEAQVATLSDVTVRSTSVTSDMTPSNTGTKTTVSDTVLQRLPTTNRNLTDFIKLTPQVSTAGAGFSGGGMSNRMNNVQIDGATERDVFGLGSTGQPGGQISAKAISIDAVKEFQVLLAPFDVRQGNFGGLLLNAVTKSGTNDWTGSAFRYYRNQDYGRNVPALRATEFKRDQYGFSLGGPIMKNRLHFFTANEWQRESAPVSGPFRGQDPGATPAFPFTEAELTRFEAAYAAKGGNAGVIGQVNTTSPMTNYFGRLDFKISDVHRLVARYNYTDALNDGRRQNARTVTRGVYTSNFHSINSNKKAPVVQLFSNFSNGWSNEAFVGAAIVRDRRRPGDIFPEITVNYSGSRTLIAGADASSQGNELDADTYEFTDNLTIPMGDHNFVVGTRNELVKIRNLFAQNSFGRWTFPTIDAFESGLGATSLAKASILSNGGNAYFDALQTALYAQDQWNASPRLALTMGLRADISNFLLENSYAPAIDSAFGRRETPDRAVQVSPRFGFNWDATGNQRNQLRGGIGMFVGTPPYVWMENAYIDNGRVIANLTCGGTATPAPAFTTDATKLQTCANGTGSKPIGNVSFLDKNIKFPQPLRANLAFDRALGESNMIATIEGLFSKTLNQLFFVNRNLAGPVGTDKFGRVLYGSIATGGQSTALRPAGVLANGGVARFASAIDLKNQNKDYAFNLTSQLRKRYADNWEALIAYTYSRARDVQSFSSSTHASNWAFGRTISGRQEEAFRGISNFDQPHKVVGFVTSTLHWGAGLGDWAQKLSTDFTFSYQGVSGSPHDYTYTGSGGQNPRGDLNADGNNANDLIYIPRDARDPNEIRFANLTTSGQVLTAAEQAGAFEQLISQNACLNDARGTIMKRNSCRLPWSNLVDVQIRQSIPTIMDQRLSIMLDIFNFGNMLNKNWGKLRVNPLSGNSNIPLLEHTGNSSADPLVAVPIVQYNFLRFDADRTGLPRAYQSSTGSPFNFWRMQLAARYSF